MLRGLALVALVSMFLPATSGTAVQRTVKASEAWVTASASTEAMAYLVLENGTMYDVYLTAVETEAAQAVELRQMTGGKATTVKEVMVPAFDRVVLTSEGPHLKLTGLRRALKAGETITLALQLDSGDRLSIEATVK